MAKNRAACFLNSQCLIKLVYIGDFAFVFAFTAFAKTYTKPISLTQRNKQTLRKY